MTVSSLEDIRCEVAGPSRYLGCEVNTVKKRHDAVKLRMALAFPDLYDIGTSHFGLQILYQILNENPDIAAERVFAPGLDMAGALRREGLPLFSLESQTPLKQFDMIGFSLLYELNFSNVLAMLDLAGIPFRAARRGTEFPLIIAGGPCTVNPEPMAEFFDAMVVGDGEFVICEMARAWMQWAESGERDKQTLYSRWEQIEGVYVPSFFEPRWDGSGFQTLLPKRENGKDAVGPSVTRALVPDLDQAPFPEAPIVPFGRPVHDRLRIEVARGCTRGCRFCQAGMIYRPVRERSLENLEGLTRRALACTGYDDISLLSLSTGDYSCLTPLMQDLIRSRRSDPVAVSLPSFRAGTLSREMMALVRKVRKTGFTIAPEAGSERLRRVINKNLSEEEILETIEHAFALGWQVIKLYFMIGLPTETRADIDAIVDLVKKIRRRKGKAGKKAKINVSVATFIPKPHTPFQWAGQLPVGEASEIIEFLHERLKMPGVQFKWQNPEVSRMEGLWARGDRKLAGLLEAAYQKGCQFDGWSDAFDYDAWLAACRETGIDPDFYVHRPRGLDEPLPWDPIDCRIRKSFLWKEFENSMEEVFTPDCRFEQCSGCGSCDFSAVRPRMADEDFPPGPRKPEAETDRTESKESGVEIRLRMRYAKLGPARYFGQLELIQIFLRALRRAGIEMKYSQGFHPKPKISFHEALPVGVESRREEFCLSVHAAPAGEADAQYDTEAAVSRINRHLTEGLTLLDCQAVPPKTGPEPEAERCYHIYRYDGGIFDQGRVAVFDSVEAYPIERRNRKNQVLTQDLKTILKEISLKAPNHVFLRLGSAPGKGLRPGEAVEILFDLPSAVVRCLKIVKVPADEAG